MKIKLYLFLLLSQSLIFAPASAQIDSTAQTNDPLLKFHRIKLREAAVTEAKLHAKISREKYSGDDNMEHALYKFYFARNMEINHTILKYDKSVELQRNSKKKKHLRYLI